MSEIFTEQLTALANIALAAFAIVTAVLAGLAFLKQRQEVHAVEQQVADGQETAKQQAELLEVQAGQLEVLRAQLEDQRAATAKQAEVLELQATELRESLEERKQSADRRRREQATHVFLTEKRHPYVHNSPVTGGGHASVRASITNNSDEPLYEAGLRWHVDGKPYTRPELEAVGTILPGDVAVKSQTFPKNSDLDVCGAVLEFRDAAGVRWLRHPDGDLSELQP